jgi:Domain of unknown function (DUF4251)
MKYLLSIVAVLLTLTVSSGQETKSDATTDIASMVQDRKFEFAAESAHPMRGRTIFLSPGYLLEVRPDSVVSYLPYYGRAYQATMDPSKSGIKFTSTDFEYIEKPGKKSGWQIQIRAKDVPQSPQLHLSIQENGQATLRVTSIDRESISFHGYIRRKAN